MHMKKRRVLKGLAALTLGARMSRSVSAAAQSPHPSDLTATLAALASGGTTSLALVRQSLARIHQFDQRGPKINAVIELNPDAIDAARALDHERKSGKLRSPLHGVPILIKDNVATGDRMKTTAGSLALAEHPAHADAHIVKRLREAGLVIIGKTNLSEWANFRSSRSLSGWSGRGGLTRNPYALDRNTSGSSSGSGAAVAAGYVPFAVGTETDGSIVSPAQINGLVGLKPTLGLVSRHGIIPIAESQDTAGPMSCTVHDAALLLQVLAGKDPADPITTKAPAAPDYVTALRKDGLRGARLGVVRGYFGSNPDVNALIDDAIKVLVAQGAVIVDPVALPDPATYGDAETTVLLHEFKTGMASYLAEFAPNSGLHGLADLIAWNRREAGREMPFFGQDLMEKADATQGLHAKVYLDARAHCIEVTRTKGIEKALADGHLDALIAPTGGPAWMTDFVNGDNSGFSFSGPAAVAGLPHLTVPAGLVHGLPVGLSFVGAAWSEATLLRLGYAYEQASHARQLPTYVAHIPLPGSA